MKEQRPDISWRRICLFLEVPRSSISYLPSDNKIRISRPLDPLLVERIAQLIKDHPTYGYRRLWAILRFSDGLLINKKTVYRILKLNNWFCHERKHTPRPRVKGWISASTSSNERWAIDLTHIYCGSDG